MTESRSAAEAVARLTSALADRYRIERELGAGGMATVYLAEDLKHDRKVAIKVLRPELAAVIGAERFLKEIKTTANLQHPHILGLIDSGNSDSFLWYAMPFVDGESLRDRLQREKQLPIADAVRIATEVAGALDYAHRHGVIHRDIKPENILLHDGSALVADFGIALAASTAGTRMTETGMSLGTPHYMSPEQAMGEREITARSDVYALGCVLYEMLVGDPPFTGSTAQAIVAKVVTEKPAVPSRIRDTIPPVVEDAVLTALEKLPADRFATAAEFATALAGGATIRATARAARPAERSAERRVLFVAVITLAACCVAGGWLLGRRGGGSSTGPSVYDASLPDSALVSFSASTRAVSYGTAFRNISTAGSGNFVVYAAKHGDSDALWYRSLRTADVHPIPGTAGATAPRVSPDGSQVAFLLGDQVMVIPIAGGEPRRLLDGKNASWLMWTGAGQLLASDADGNRLSYLDPAGGTPRSKAITRCAFGGTWVVSLKQLVCSVNRTGLFVDPESGKQWTIREAGAAGALGKVVVGSSFRLVDDHYLIYLAVDGSLVAAKFDPATHTAGKGVTLLAGMRREAIGEGQYDLAANGSLVYAPGADATAGRIVKLMPGKEPEPLPIELADFQRFDLTGDGRWLAAAVQGPIENELRLYDLRGGQHFTWLRGEYVRHPIWDPTGQKLLVMTRELDRWAILRGSPNSGTSPDTLLSAAGDAAPPDPIDYHDEHVSLAQNWTGNIIFRFDPSTSRASFDTVIVGGRFASLSPKGSLILYQTLDGNRVMVTSFPTPGRRWQIASDGSEPIWLSASEVIFRVGVTWYLARVNPESGEPLGPPTLWGRDPRFSDTPGWSNRPSHDGGIIYIEGPAQNSGNHFRVVPNWVAQMKAAVDGAKP
jgi:serine/threonine-protein kinase